MIKKILEVKNPAYGGKTLQGFFFKKNKYQKIIEK